MANTDFLNTWNKEDFLTYPIGPLGLIAMPGMEDMGEKVDSWLKKWRDSLDNEMRTTPGVERHDFLVHVACPRYGNGEAKGMIKESIRGFDMYILCDSGAYNIEYNMYGQRVPMSPDEHYSNLKRVIVAMGGKAKRVSVIMPLLYEGRQHRRTSRESLDCAMALQELEDLGVSNIITFDAHDSRVQNSIPTVGFENVMPSYQIFKALLMKEKTLRINKSNIMVVSPDEGAINRNIFYASVLGLNMGLFYKRRDYTRIENGRNPIIAYEYLGDSVEGKDIFVAYDMISSGESIIDLAKELKKRGANRIFAGCTFALFTNGIKPFEEAYQAGLINRVISTNLTYRRPELIKSEWFIEADISKYISYIIATLNHNRSLSKLLNPYNKIQALIDECENDQWIYERKDI